MIARKYDHGSDLSIQSGIQESDSGAIEIVRNIALRSAYSFDSARVCVALRGFAGLPRVSLEDPALMATALDRTAHGLDFADALHLGRAEDRGDFATFDRQLIRAARAAGLGNVRAP